MKNKGKRISVTILVIIIITGLVYILTNYLDFLKTAIVGSSIPKPDACIELEGFEGKQTQKQIRGKVVLIRDVNVLFEYNSNELPEELEGKRGFDSKLTNPHASYFCQEVKEFVEKLPELTKYNLGVDIQEVIDYRTPINHISQIDSQSIISSSGGYTEFVSHDWKIGPSDLITNDPKFVEKYLQEPRPDFLLLMYNNTNEFQNIYIPVDNWDSLHAAATTHPPTSALAGVTPIFFQYKPSWLQNNVNLFEMIEHEIAHFIEYNLMLAYNGDLLDQTFPKVHSYNKDHTKNTSTWIAQNMISQYPRKFTLERTFIEQYIFPNFVNKQNVEKLLSITRNPSIVFPDSNPQKYNSNFELFEENIRRAPNIIEIIPIENENSIVFLSQVTEPNFEFNIKIYKEGQLIDSFIKNIFPFEESFKKTLLIQYNYIPTYNEEVYYHKLNLSELKPGIYQIEISAITNEEDLLNSEVSPQFPIY